MRKISHLYSPKMKNSSIIFFKRVVIANDSEEKIAILCQICSGSEKPTISKFSLLHVKTRISFDEELWISTDFGWSEPFKVSINLTSEIKTRNISWKFWIFKETTRLVQFITNLIKVLSVLLLSFSIRLVGFLK